MKTLLSIFHETLSTDLISWTYFWPWMKHYWPLFTIFFFPGTSTLRKCTRRRWARSWSTWKGSPMARGYVWPKLLPYGWARVRSPRPLWRSWSTSIRYNHIKYLWVYLFIMMKIFKLTTHETLSTDLILSVFFQEFLPQFGPFSNLFTI